jgi:hypothetical protein
VLAPIVGALVQAQVETPAGAAAQVASDSLAHGGLAADLRFWQAQAQRTARGQLGGVVHCLCTEMSAP